MAPVTQDNLTQEQLEALAKEKGITVEELKAELEAEGDTDLDDEEIVALLEKHKSDPKALAKALKSSRQEVAEKVLEAKRERERLEEENKRLRKKDEPPKGDVRKIFREKLKPVYNSETGEYEVSDDAIEVLVGLSHKISSAQVEPIYERLAASEIRSQKSDIRSLPHFKEVEKDIDELLSKMPIRERMKEGAVLAAYKYAIGEKTLRDADKKPDAKADIDLHKGSGSSGGRPPLKKLTAEQLEEFDKTWRAKGFDEDDYLELLNRMVEQDKAKGFKTKRTLIAERITT